MKVRDIMTEHVKVARPNETLQCAARAMRTIDVGALPVCDGERLLGMLTDRDISMRAVAEGLDPSTAVVREAMSSDIVYCFDDQETQEAEAIMQERQIRRLPVLDRSKRLVGIISLGDLATRTHDLEEVGATLERVSERKLPTVTDLAAAHAQPLV